MKYIVLLFILFVSCTPIRVCVETDMDYFDNELKASVRDGFGDTYFSGIKKDTIQ
jgi:hypothetical protein